MEYNHIPESMGQVGIFWIIDGDIAGYGLESCAGGNYGDFKIYPGDHYGTWNDICRESQELLLYAYDYFPRGRIAYNTVKDLYLIYIDRCIDTELSRRSLVERFKIPANHEFKYDVHYSCNGCLNLVEHLFN